MTRAPVINGARFRASLMGFEGWVCQSHATASWTAVAEMQGASLHRRHRFREVSDFLLTLTRRPTCERGVAPRPARPSKLQQRRAARIDSLCSPFRQSVAVYLRCAPVPRRCRVCVSTGPSSIFRLRKRTAPRLDREPFTPFINGTQSRRDAIIFMGLPHHLQQRPLGPRHSNAAPLKRPHLLAPKCTSHSPSFSTLRIFWQPHVLFSHLAPHHTSPNGAAHHSEGLPSLGEATLVPADKNPGSKASALFTHRASQQRLSRPPAAAIGERSQTLKNASFTSSACLCQPSAPKPNRL